jgi:hypothetical protein
MVLRGSESIPAAVPLHLRLSPRSSMCPCLTSESVIIAGHHDEGPADTPGRARAARPGPAGAESFRPERPSQNFACPTSESGCRKSEPQFCRQGKSPLSRSQAWSRQVAGIKSPSQVGVKPGPRRRAVPTFRTIQNNNDDNLYYCYCYIHSVIH